MIRGGLIEAIVQKYCWYFKRTAKQSKPLPEGQHSNSTFQHTKNRISWIIMENNRELQTTNAVIWCIKPSGLFKAQPLIMARGVATMSYYQTNTGQGKETRVDRLLVILCATQFIPNCSTLFKSTMTYGLETTVLSKRQEVKMEVAELKMVK